MEQALSVPNMECPSLCIVHFVGNMGHMSLLHDMQPCSQDPPSKEGPGDEAA